MYSSYDVGKFLDSKRGYSDLNNFDYASLFNTTFGMDKAQRISTFDSGSTHAMTLTAVDLDAQGNPVKWKVEKIKAGDILSIDLDTGKIVDKTTGDTFQAPPLPGFIQDIAKAGGLINYVKESK